MGFNPTGEQLKQFREKNLRRKRLPNNIMDDVLARIRETTDVSGMTPIGLNLRLRNVKGLNKMEVWREAVKATLENPATTGSEDSGSKTILTKRGDNDDKEGNVDNLRAVTTTLRRIVRSEHNLDDIEQLLVSEQRANHEVFESYYRIIQEVTNMVRFV
jgi:hypothetical protein